MITERLTFQAKYGHGDELVELMKSSMDMMPSDDVSSMRLYTDFTGKMFTVAMEFDYADLNAYARANQGQEAEYANPSFQEWFAKMVAVTDGGEKQLFNSEKLK